MLVVSYRARITLTSGQVIDLDCRNLKSLTSAIAYYDNFDISIVVIMKCKQVVSDGETT